MLQYHSCNSHHASVQVSSFVGISEIRKSKMSLYIMLPRLASCICLYCSCCRLGIYTVATFKLYGKCAVCRAAPIIKYRSYLTVGRNADNNARFSMDKASMEAIPSTSVHGSSSVIQPISIPPAGAVAVIFILVILAGILY